MNDPIANEAAMPLSHTRDQYDCLAEAYGEALQFAETDGLVAQGKGIEEHPLYRVASIAGIGGPIGRMLETIDAVCQDAEEGYDPDLVIAGLLSAMTTLALTVKIVRHAATADALKAGAKA